MMSTAMPGTSTLAEAGARLGLAGLEAGEGGEGMAAATPGVVPAQTFAAAFGQTLIQQGQPEISEGGNEALQLLPAAYWLDGSKLGAATALKGEVFTPADNGLGTALPFLAEGRIAAVEVLAKPALAGIEKLSNEVGGEGQPLLTEEATPTGWQGSSPLVPQKIMNTASSATTGPTVHSGVKIHPSKPLVAATQVRLAAGEHAMKAEGDGTTLLSSAAAKVLPTLIEGGSAETPENFPSKLRPISIATSGDILPEAAKPGDQVQPAGKQPDGAAHADRVAAEARSMPETQAAPTIQANGTASPGIISPQAGASAGRTLPPSMNGLDQSTARNMRPAAVQAQSLAPATNSATAAPEISPKNHPLPTAVEAKTVAAENTSARKPRVQPQQNYRESVSSALSMPRPQGIPISSELSSRETAVEPAPALTQPASKAEEPIAPGNSEKRIQGTNQGKTMPGLAKAAVESGTMQLAARTEGSPENAEQAGKTAPAPQSNGKQPAVEIAVSITPPKLEAGEPNATTASLAENQERLPRENFAGAKMNWLRSAALGTANPSAPDADAAAAKVADVRRAPEEAKAGNTQIAAQAASEANAASWSGNGAGFSPRTAREALLTRGEAGSSPMGSEAESARQPVPARSSHAGTTAAKEEVMPLRSGNRPVLPTTDIESGGAEAFRPAGQGVKTAEWMPAEVKPAVSHEGLTPLVLTALAGLRMPERVELPRGIMAHRAFSFAEKQEILLASLSESAAQVRTQSMDAMTVVLRPDGKTEIALQLARSGDQIEVHARCDRGDFRELTRHWDELRQTLASQGTRLHELESPAGRGGQSGQDRGDGNGWRGEDGRPQGRQEQPSRRLAEEFASADAKGKGPSANRGRGSGKRGVWEHWV